ncbi:MAG: hypothetical protein AB7K09_06140 [Planctomycetota bacterium]
MVLRRPRVFSILWIAFLFPAAAWFAVSCARDGEQAVNMGNEARNAGADNAADNTAAAEDGGRPDLMLTDQQKIQAQINRQRAWWKSILNPTDPDERFAYMKKMMASMRFFQQAGAWQLIQTPMRLQAEQKRREPVFMALYAALNAMTPPPTGNPQSRAGAVQQLKAALGIAPDFAHGWYLLGFVTLMDQQATRRADADVIGTAVEQLNHALALHPDFPDAHQHLAVAYTMLRQTDAAIEHGRAAILAEPEDERNWVRYVGVLEQLGAVTEMERCSDLIKENNPSPRVRLVIFGQLAEFMANTGQFQKGFDFMREAEAAAHMAGPDVLRAGQWIAIYCAIARLAVMKPEADETLAVGYLAQAAEHSRTIKLSLMRVITAWTEVLPRLPNPEAHLQTLIDLCFEAMGDEALSDMDRGRLTQIIATFLSKANLADIKRERLAQLLAWTLDQIQAGNDMLLELAIKLAQALLPVKDENGKPRIAPAAAAALDTQLAAALVTVLSSKAVESIEYRITLPGTEWLGHLLTATRGVHDSLFIERAKEVLQRPVTRDMTTRKMNVCEVLRRHPINELNPYLVVAMQRTIESDLIEESRRLFMTVHSALQASFQADDLPAGLRDFRPDRNTPMDDMKRIMKAWEQQITAR